jgi:hypothetical protein
MRVALIAKNLVVVIVFQSFPLLLPIPQPFLRRHKFPDPNWYTLKQVLPWCQRRGAVPQGLTTASIIIHANRGIRYLRSRHSYFWTVHPPTVSLRLRLSQPYSPALNLISVIIPNTVYAAAHAAVIRLGWPRWDGYTVNGPPCRIWGIRSPAPVFPFRAVEDLGAGGFWLHLLGLPRFCSLGYCHREEVFVEAAEGLGLGLI